jgi:hypothetical protein
MDGWQEGYLHARWSLNCVIYQKRKVEHEGGSCIGCSQWDFENLPLMTIDSLVGVGY